MKQASQITLLNPILCNIDSLVHKQHHRDYQLWYDQQQRKQYYQYKLYGWPNQKQMEIYQYRKHTKENLIYVHYIAPVNNSGYKQFCVFIQKIHLVFSTLVKLTFSQGLYLLKNVLSGFQILFQKFGYVHIDNKLIGLNSLGNVKVWINENFAFNGVASTHLAPKWMSEEMKQKQMIATIFSIVQDKLEKNGRLLQFKKEKQLKLLSITFQTTLKFLDNYIKMHDITIPQSIPQLIQVVKNENTRIEFGRGSNNQKQFLAFKSSSPRRKGFKNSIIQSKYFKNGLSGSPRGKRLMTLYDRFLSPSQNAVRARNRSEAAFSIASSRPRTTFTIRQPKPTKYFYCNRDSKARLEVPQRQNNFLQSSQISRDFCFPEGSKNQVQILPHKQRPSQSQKKRKYSAADKMIINGFNATPKIKQQRAIALALARSMVLKNKLEDSRKVQNINSQEIVSNLEPSSQQDKKFINPCVPKRNNPQNQTQPEYQSNTKTFLNYKSVKKSIINNNKQGKKQTKIQLAPNLKNSFLKNMAMKNSQIIMQKSSEYASIQDMMNTINQIQTPQSDQCFQTFASSGQRKASLFVGSVRQRKNSDINISNSTTDRKSGLQQQGKDCSGFINFASPTRHKQLKQGMFKSIFVQQSRQEQVSEIQQHQ